MQNTRLLKVASAFILLGLSGIDVSHSRDELERRSNGLSDGVPFQAPHFVMEGIRPLDTSLAAAPIGNVVRIGSGNSVSFCPHRSCVREPSTDHQRTSLLVSAVTQDDMHSEEQALAVHTIINRGALKKWAPGTNFAVGDNINFGGARNSVYRAVQAGRSAATGAGPVGKGERIRDGSVIWEWINDSAIAAKVGAYIETSVMPGAGPAWGAAFNYHLLPGAEPSFNPGVEFDYTNASGRNCALGVADCTHLRVAAGGDNQITTNLAVVSDNTSSYAAIWGLRLNGDFLASEAVIAVDASSKVGLAFGRSGIGGASHSVATIEDATNSPTAFSIGGKKTIAGIVERSTSPNGIALNGRYSGAQIIGKGFAVDPDGNVSAKSIIEHGNDVPKSSRSPCRVGQRAWDANYEYRCVAENSWKRAVLSNW